MLSEIRTRVANILDRDDLIDAQLDQWINDAQRTICKRHDFAFMESQDTSASTVDGTESYALPTDFKAEIALELQTSEGYRLPQLRGFKNELQKRAEYSDTTTTGEPRYYAIQNGYVWFYDTPADVYTIDIEYYAYLADLVDDTDTNGLVEANPIVLSYLASSYGFDYSYEPDKAKYWESRAIEGLGLMILDDKAHQFSNIEIGLEPDNNTGTTRRGQYGL